MATQQKNITPEKENIVPFRPMSMFEEMEHMLENIVPHNWLHPLRREQALFAEGMPRVDVIDKDDTILVRAALPGVDKDDLSVSTTPQTVTIRGSTRKEIKEEKGEYFRCEISSGSFLRTVTLPAPVNEDKVTAKFRDGLLELVLPKLESARRHSIKIETG
jgi:HSP20 family protein